ncbi:hypothetical protein Adt_11598 [Abeliophyllum distichum]|uniref:Uncharacterized protein n=1 Tax=Abeliophyllum distichum TaxID=126358 RepID=A0ABD1UNB1_9LAMI
MVMLEARIHVEVQVSYSLPASLEETTFHCFVFNMVKQTLQPIGDNAKLVTSTGNKDGSRPCSSATSWHKPAVIREVLGERKRHIRRVGWILKGTHCSDQASTTPSRAPPKTDQSFESDSQVAKMSKDLAHFQVKLEKMAGVMNTFTAM